MIEPTQVIEAFKKHTSSLLVPTSSSSPVSPLPTVSPDTPRYEEVGASGTRTLWVRPLNILPAVSTNNFTGRLRSHVPLYPRICDLGIQNASGKLVCISA